MSLEDELHEALVLKAADVRAWTESVECLLSRLRGETRQLERGELLGCDLAELTEVSARLLHSVAGLNTLALLDKRVTP